MSYGRRLELNVGNISIKHESGIDLRVAFDVARDKSRDPNAATVQIWGLAPATRSGLQEKGRLFCELDVGYADEGVHNIFTGVLLDVQSIREGADIVTTITLGDAADVKTASLRIHKLFPKLTPISTVLTELVKATGLKGGNLSLASASARLAASTVLQRPWLATGQAIGELHAFTRSLGFEWSLQDQTVVFSGFGSGVTGSGVVLRGDNVAETPAVDAEGSVTFTTRMVADLVPGRPFRLATEGVQGDFVCTESRHFGDTHGPDWSVEVTGSPFSGSVSKGLVVNGA